MISDLLASITGEKSSTSPTTAPKPTAGLPKRKAEDEIRGASTKLPRTESTTNGSARQNGSSSRPPPRPVDRPSPTTTSRPSTTPSSSVKPSSSAVKVTSNTANNSRSLSTSSNKPLPTRPIVNRPVAAPSGTKAQPPKKGSFAETLARAKALTEQRSSFGKIQHKPIEKSLTMKERKELKAEDTRQVKNGVRPQAHQRNGTIASSRMGVSNSSKREPLSSKTAKSASVRGRSSLTPPPEKKVKKAALATTGYTGTARPRPGARPSKPGAGAQPQREDSRYDRPRYGGALSSRRRYDEENEMDDFIDYDDEEEDAGPARRRRYEDYSDVDESDMEAGREDLDEEERRAEIIALEDDRKEQLLELRLKREKMERRSQLASRGSGR